MTGPDRVVAAARGAIGAKFRLHGRDPLFGLDCVGLAGLAMRAAGCDDDVPMAYALRGGMADGFVGLIDRDALVRTAVPRPGDLMLFAAGPVQFHIAIKCPGGFVHADAMLRRVVERPDPAPWPLVAAWTLADAYR